MKRLIVGALLSGGVALAGFGLSMATAQAFDPQPEPPLRIGTRCPARLIRRHFHDARSRRPRQECTYGRERIEITTLCATSSNQRHVIRGPVAS